MYISGIIDNDFSDSINGVCVSLWVSGCPHRCKGCHNAQTWNFTNGDDVEIYKLINLLSDKISADGITRQFSVLGGEPLCEENIENVSIIIEEIRKRFANITIYIWSGYSYKEIKKNVFWKNKISKFADILVDGKFEIDMRDTNLALRGSKNQNIWKRYKNKWKNVSELVDNKINVL